MKFGLPDDYELVVGTVGTLSNENGLSKPILTVDELDLFGDELSKLVGVPVQSPLTRFDELKQVITNVIEENSQVDFQENWDDSIRISAEVNIKYITSKLELTLANQNKEVKLLIDQHNEQLRIEAERKEKERLRKIQEEQRRIEEEAKQKQMEEEKQKRLEEEKKRKEEEAKQKKLVQEKELKAKQEQELQKQKQAELDKQNKDKLEAEETKRKQELKAKQLSAKTNFVAIEKQFLKYKQDIVDIKTNVVEKLSQNPDIKKQVNQVKRKINPKFGQLSNSMSQLQKITQEVIQFINLTKENELAYKWILNFVAKAIVDQAETEVIVKPTAALPLARLTYSLLSHFPEFSYYLIARFVKKCPYLIGYTCTIDTEEGRTRMGYKRRNNQWEDSVKYDERVSGICTVWAVLTRLSDKGQLDEYSFQASWKFLARILNTDLQLITNTHFAIVANWWEAAAAQFLTTYGNQSQKLLVTLVRDWPLAVSDKKFPAAARLLILGEEWGKSNRITSLKEMER